MLSQSKWQIDKMTDAVADTKRNLEAHIVH